MDIKSYTDKYDLESLRKSQSRLTWAEKDRRKRMEQSDPNEPVVPIEREDLPEVGYEHYRVVLWYFLNENATKQLTYTDEQVRITKKIIRYLIGTSEELKPDKGICLIGPYGTGKTTLADAICKASRALREAPNITHWDKRMQYKRTLKRAMQEGWIQKGLYDKSTENLYIDDLGFLDEDKVKHYGNEINVVSDLITDRYEQWRYSGKKTMITTNMTLDYIDTTYGQGILGRLLDMCHVVHWDGVDYRITSK